MKEMHKKVSLILASGLVLTVTATGIASAAFTTLPPNLIVKFNSEILPQTLPKHRFGSVAMKVSGNFSTADGSHPPALREAIIDFDTNIIVDADGLPICKRSQLEVRHADRDARRACRKSILGNGAAHVKIDSREDQVSIPLVLFNGGVRDSTTKLFLYGYLSKPNPTPVITPVEIRRTHNGRSALRVIAKIPQIDSGHGSVLDFGFEIKRLFQREGKRRSYLSARCVDDQLNTNVIKFLFRNEVSTPGTPSTSVVKGAFRQTCTSRLAN